MIDSPSKPTAPPTKSRFADDPDTHRLGDQIGRLLRNLGLADDFRGWMVAQEWPKIVGPSIAERAQAVRYQDHTLFVRVTDSRWRHSLACETDALLAKIHERPGGDVIASIEILAG